MAARVHDDGVVGGARGRGVEAALEAAGAADVVRHLDEVVDFALRYVSLLLLPLDGEMEWGRNGEGGGKGHSRCSDTA